MFQLSNIHKSFGGHTVLGGVTWRIDAQDRVGLVGPNGTGKTTLLRIMVGEASADSGEFLSPRGTRIGYLAQEVRQVQGTTVLADVLAAVGQAQGIEKEMAELEQSMATASREEAEALAHLHGELQEQFQALDGYTLEARAREILSGLGFPEKEMERPRSELSGGWSMRVELARHLLAQPDLLLLDEPTNHLDLESLEWLEGFLQDYKGSCVVVSHDRYFLNRMVHKIVDLGLAEAFVFNGNYDQYLVAREEVVDRLAKEAAAQHRRMEEIQEFIDRFKAKATKARQAQSRLKQLQRMEKEMAAKPALMAPKQRRKTLKFKLPEPPRAGDRVITLTDVKKAYGKHVVYEDLSFGVQRGEKVALVGVNGAGKTTLLKMLAGILKPEGGTLQLGHNVEPFYFAQHQVDTLDSRKTVLNELWDVVRTEGESRVRGILGAFLFSGDDVDKKVGVLSGGEKSRLALAKMLAKPGNLLLLDEPTNHLDLESREMVEEAFAGYAGTIVLISHDRYFINRVATRVVEIKVGGIVNDYPGDYDYYTWKRSEEEKRATASKKKIKKAPSVDKRAAQKEREDRKKAARESGRREKEAQKVESALQLAEKRMKEIDDLMCDPTVYADAPRCKELLGERATLEEKVKRLYAKWERLESSGS